MDKSAGNYKKISFPVEPYGCIGVDPADKVLPTLYIALNTAFVSVHSHMLGLRCRSNQQTRARAWVIFGRAARTALSSVGRKRLRPRTIRVLWKSF